MTTAWDPDRDAKVRRGPVSPLFLALALGGVALLVMAGLVGSCRSGGPRVVIIHGRDARVLPFLVAEAREWFAAEGLNVRLQPWTEDDPAREPPWEQVFERLAGGDCDAVAGCPAAVLRAAVERRPEAFLWFAPVFETADGDALSAVVVRADAGITTLDDVDRRIASDPTALLLTGPSWDHDARQLWPKSAPRVAESLSPDDLAPGPAPLLFGDATVLHSLTADPRFLLLATNVRARRSGGPYWDGATVIRSDSPGEVARGVSSAVRRALETLRGHPEESRKLLDDLFDDEDAPRIAIGTSPPPTDEASAAALRLWTAGIPETPRALLLHARWQPIPPPALESEDLPPFSGPKPKELLASPSD